MKKLTLFLLLAILPAALFARRDSVEVLDRAALFDAAFRRVVDDFYGESSVSMLHRSEVSLSTLDLRFDLRREQEARLQPLGDGAFSGRLHVDSYLRLDDRSAVWGHARYERGSRRNVCWNSTSDYLLLYPYVVADSVGGALSTEEYAFGGGYARRVGRVDLAIAADYRAGQEYRQVDPRPHDKVSDFSLSIGAGLEFSHYAAGIDLGFRLYGQDQSVKFYDPRGNCCDEFFMLGLGSYYARYSGAISSTLPVDYDGSGYRAAVHLTPRDGRGWYARLACDLFTVDMMYRQNNHIPVTSLRTCRATAAAAYRTGRWSLRAEAGYERRDGTEMVADRNGQGKIVDEQRMYRSECWRAAAEATVAWNRGAFRYTFQPRVAWWRSAASYLYPAREMILSQLHGALRGGMEWRDARWRVKGALGIGCSLSPDPELSLPDVRTSIGEFLAVTADRLTDRAVTAEVSLRVERRVNRRTACFVEAGWAPRFYGGSSQHALTAACGILF